ncbi:MAG: bifunctional precorrin-2 dehydrogenase/sirohydrochlorin ferrochelatase [Candidatus Omnitrophica bacterium]|nr:bifunctional precorrin-2 dehydrogenase/sirohydrochlorin ferrochelatase [Candidatus Omnitrophota bacterium]
MRQKAYYPINVDLEGRKCLVVGGGDVAERKVQTLLSFGATVTLVSPEITPKISALVKAKKIFYIKRGYQKKDLKDVFLVIAATDVPEVNAQVARHAESRNLLLNVVDVPKLCNFIVPSVVRRGPLTIGISTGGQSPMFAQMWRKKCEKCLTPAHVAFLKMLGGTRKEVRVKHVTMAKCKVVYRKILNSPVLSLLQKDKPREAKILLRKIIRKGSL